MEGRKGQESAGGAFIFKFRTWYQQAAKVKNHYALTLKIPHLCASIHENMHVHILNPKASSSSWSQLNPLFPRKVEHPSKQRAVFPCVPMLFPVRQSYGLPLFLDSSLVLSKHSLRCFAQVVTQGSEHGYVMIICLIWKTWTLEAGSMLCPNYPT